MTDSVYWIWFQLLFGIGTRRAELFLNYFAGPKELHDGLLAKAPFCEMLSKKEKAVWRPAMEQAQNLQNRTLRKGCEIITPDHPAYPRLLLQIYSKPAVLYVKGDLSCLEKGLHIAMVGTRNHTEYGEKAAKMLAGDLARNGATVVSGLAKGIDTFCHKAALEAGGYTIGVLGCGLDIDYPRGSASLKSAMAKRGAVITEYPLGTTPRPGLFPIRNRIISGMCHGTVVVEADKSSGSILTAEHALEQGRDVFAVPGSIFSIREQGTHALIRDGAKLVESAGDILEEYGYQSDKNSVRPLHNFPSERITIKEGPPAAVSVEPEVQQSFSMPLPENLTHEAQELYPLLKGTVYTVDELAGKSGLEIARLHAALTELEIYGLVQALPGRRFARCANHL